MMPARRLSRTNLAAVYPLLEGGVPDTHSFRRHPDGQQRHLNRRSYRGWDSNPAGMAAPLAPARMGDGGGVRRQPRVNGAPIHDVPPRLDVLLSLILILEVV